MFDPARAPSGDAPSHAGTALDLAPGKRTLLDELTSAARAGSSATVPGAQPIVPLPLQAEPGDKNVVHAIATSASATADLTGQLIDLAHDGVSPYYDRCSFEIPVGSISSLELGGDELASATAITFGLAPSTQITSFEGIVRPGKLSIDMGLHLGSVTVLPLFVFVLHLPDGRLCALTVKPWRFRVETTRRDAHQREVEVGTDRAQLDALASEGDRERDAIAHPDAIPTSSRAEVAALQQELAAVDAELAARRAALTAQWQGADPATRQRVIDFLDFVHAQHGDLAALDAQIARGDLLADAALEALEQLGDAGANQHGLAALIAQHRHFTAALPGAIASMKGEQDAAVGAARGRLARLPGETAAAQAHLRADQARAAAPLPDSYEYLDATGAVISP